MRFFSYELKAVIAGKIQVLTFSGAGILPKQEGEEEE